MERSSPLLCLHRKNEMATSSPLLSHPKIANSITELIGRTPLLRLNKLNSPGNAEILLKLECMQPSNSVKVRSEQHPSTCLPHFSFAHPTFLTPQDRIGLSMIDAAERRGTIVPGKTVLVEPTSGNTGVALAMVAAARGYSLILTMVCFP